MSQFKNYLDWGSSTASENQHHQQGLQLEQAGAGVVQARMDVSRCVFYILILFHPYFIDLKQNFKTCYTIRPNIQILSSPHDQSQDVSSTIVKFTLAQKLTITIRLPTQAQVKPMETRQPNPKGSQQG